MMDIDYVIYCRRLIHNNYHVPFKKTKKKTKAKTKNIALVANHQKLHHCKKELMLECCCICIFTMQCSMGRVQVDSFWMSSSFSLDLQATLLC